MSGRVHKYGSHNIVFPDNEQGGAGSVEAEVKWYNARKGFGFVLGPDGQDVFFHASALTEAGIEPPDTGDKLTCEIGTDRQGRRLVTRIYSVTKGAGGGDRPARPGGFGDRVGTGGAAFRIEQGEFQSGGGVAIRGGEPVVVSGKEVEVEDERLAASQESRPVAVAELVALAAEGADIFQRAAAGALWILVPIDRRGFRVICREGRGQGDQDGKDAGSHCFAGGVKARASSLVMVSAIVSTDGLAM